jgi:hypothetical protein
MDWRKLFSETIWQKLLEYVVVSLIATKFLGDTFGWVTANPYRLTLAALLLLPPLVYVLWRRYRFPIKWIPSPYFLGMRGSPSEIEVLQFQGNGINRLDRVIDELKGHLISRVDGTRSQPLEIIVGGHAHDPADTNGIPPMAQVQIQIRFVPKIADGPDALSERDFRDHWADFDFVVSADGREQTIRFDRAKVAKLLDKFKGESTPPRLPHVTLKA